MLALQTTNNTDDFAWLSAKSLASGADYLRAARETLARLLADPGVLDDVRLERIPGAYTRNLIYGDGRITIFAIVWAPGSQTSIHDHHCSCCYAMQSGALQESWYEGVDKMHAIETRTFMRNAGDIACMLPTGPNLHKMGNVSGEEAISIHIYGYDHQARASSIGREYKALEQACS